jgi:hypothetical protein
VNVQGWPEPFEFEESDADDELGEEEPVDGNEDPQFVERMAPPELDAVDEPEIGNDELAAFLEAHLLDMDEEEWLDLCKFLFGNLTTLILILFRFARFVEERYQDPRASCNPPSYSFLAHDMGRASPWGLRRASDSVRICCLAPVTHSC